MKDLLWVRLLALLMVAVLMVPLFAVAESLDVEAIVEEEAAESEQEDTEVTEIETELPGDEVTVVTEEPEGTIETVTGIEAEPVETEEGAEEETPAEATTGWYQQGEYEWRYYYSSGSYATGWLNWGDRWYYFNSSGWQIFGWDRIGDYWYYFDPTGESGHMVTGWLSLEGYWYYFNGQGHQVSGWKKIGGKWYYLDPNVMDGQMVTGWKKIGGKWYYFNGSGVMQTGWKKIGGKWYYLESSGAMATGWKQLSGKWYYLDSSGAMLASTTRVIGGVTYTFSASGVASWSSGGGSTTTPRYRALLTAQTADSSIGSYMENDLNTMANTIASIKGPSGGSYSITKVRNVNWSRLRNSIRSTFSGVKANDVVLFYYDGHGVSSEYSGMYAGALGSCPESELIPLSYLANELNSLPCKVIVFLQSCGSGAAVYNSEKEAAKADAAFNKAVIDAFASVDSGIYVNAQGEGVDPNEVDLNTGEFRIANKFYVMTSSRHMENTRVGIFTNYISAGIGRSGRMPADSNGNGYTTLAELYSYVRGRENYYGIDQQSQVYPANSSYNLFKR